MRPPPLAIRDRRRVEQRVAAALHEMQGRQYCSVEVIAAHPQMKRPAEERASLDFMLRRRSHHLSSGFSPNLRPFSDAVAARGTFAAATICLERTIAGMSMNEDHLKPVIRGPLVIALAIAVFGVLAMLIVDHGPWSRPHLQTAANHATTGAAQSVGATVTPTAPKPQLEPVAPGPKPAQPAIPASGPP